MKPGLVTVSVDYSRPVGPRSVHGGVTLQFSVATSFNFTSTAVWPRSDDCTVAVERAVLGALEEKGVANKTACRLVAVRWHDVDSCQQGFECAARAATLAAFEV
jgi:hypothetical protein